MKDHVNLACVVRKEPCMPAKDMYISAKRALHACMCQKALCVFAKEPENINHKDHAIFPQKSIMFTAKSPIFPGVCALSGTAPCEKCLIYPKKSPIYPPKRIKYLQKSPTSYMFATKALYSYSLTHLHSCTAPVVSCE